MLKQYDRQGLFKVFQIPQKSELTKYCKSLVIHRADFANTILAAEAGLLGYYHQISYRNFEPQHLSPKKKDFQALRQNGLGPLKGDALKTIRKIDELTSNSQAFGWPYVLHSASKFLAFFLLRSTRHWPILKSLEGRLASPFFELFVAQSVCTFSMERIQCRQS